MSIANSGGSFLSGLSGGLMTGMGMKERKEDRALQEKQIEATHALAKENQSLRAALGYSDGVTAGSGGSGGSSSGGGGGGGYTGAYKTQDPVNTSLPTYARALLNGISGPESAGRYNVRYTPDGGAEFDLSTGEHPRIYEDGPHGKSSAAGRYQFVAKTWDGLGGGAFTPERQDERAWQLAQKDYRARTGRDLSQDLVKDGLTESMLETLTPTWAGLANNRQGIIETYDNSLTRFRDQARASNSAPLREAPAPEAKQPSFSLADASNQDIQQRGSAMAEQLLGRFMKKG